MNLGNRIAVISDVHGERQMLQGVLGRCREASVSGVVLLGDLFDRVDQAEACAECLAGWNVAGVIGNHEREALQLQTGDASQQDGVDRLLGNLGDSLRIEDALFIHDGLDWRSGHLAANGSPASERAHLTFAGHTHYRQARDENGPLDLSLNRINLLPARRYLINPGAVVEGQFAIWDRHRAEIIFERI